MFISVTRDQIMSNIYSPILAYVTLKIHRYSIFTNSGRCYLHSTLIGCVSQVHR